MFIQRAKKILNEKRKQHKWLLFVLCLSAAVAFGSVAALVYPAITMTQEVYEDADSYPAPQNEERTAALVEETGVQEAADELSGELETAQTAEVQETEAPETQVPETQAPETQAPETEAPETEAPETQAPETQAPETEAPETEAPETEAPETEAPGTEAPETDAIEGESEAPETEAPTDEETEAPTETAVLFPAQTFSASANGVAVSVSAPEGAFPDGTAMKVTAVPQSEVLEAVENAVEGEVKSVRAVDICFYDKGGKEIEPAQPISVTITSSQIGRAADPVIVHMDDDGEASVVEGEVNNNEFTFESADFSYYIIASTVIERTVEASDGSTYKVTVTYDGSAEIPDGARVEVKELPNLPADSVEYKTEFSEFESYDYYVEKAEQALSIPEGFATYVRLFDITIVDADGQKVDVKAPVTVSIRLLDKEDADTPENDPRVVHFENNVTPEVISTDVEGRDVTFESGSFSVYAVIDDGGTISRATLEFYNGDELVATMYVKNNDTTAEIEKIIYDPGVGELPNGEIFKGWVLNNKNYTMDDINAAMDVSQIRTWAESMALSIEGGEVYKFYAGLVKNYVVSFVDENNTTLGSNSILLLPDETTATFKINQAYTPVDSEHAFLGWNVSEGSTFIEGHTEDKLYENGETITITAPGVDTKVHIIFSVNSPEGHWLVFDENGKGATYNAPQFVKAGEVTVKPPLAEDANMKRLGYTFGGWYTNAACTPGNEFSFGGEISDRTTIYAKWTPVPQADYTVIIWRQNVDGDGYDFVQSVPLRGPVNTNVNTVSQQSTGNNAYARINGRNYQYTGFHLDHYDQGVTITPEGNAVVNVYYDRTEYTLSFQIYDYTYTETTSNNGTQYGFYNGEYVRIYYNNGTWYRTRTSAGWGYTYSNPYTGTRYTRSNNQSWHTIKEIKALYEQNISDQFPIVGTNGVTYDQGERWDPQSNTPYSEVLVYIDVMPSANVTFHLDTADRPLKTMNWYVEALPGDTGTVTAPATVYEPTNNGAVSTAGRRFVLYKSISARYNGVTPDEDFIQIDGFTRLGADSAWQRIQTGGSWYNPTYTNFYIYDTARDGTVNFYYTRDHYPINYMDGSYFDGNGNPITTEANRGQLHIEEGITYQADMASYNKGGANAYEPTYTGYVFEGWYVDDTCTTPYTFTKMPEGGITVYAKWRQVQYRVFLHSTAEGDSSVYWGSDDQERSFRVSYGGQVSAPDGQRTGYEFVGWYFTYDPATKNYSNLFSPDFKLMKPTDSSQADRKSTRLNSSHTDSSRMPSSA